MKQGSVAEEGSDGLCHGVSPHWSDIASCVNEMWFLRSCAKMVYLEWRVWSRPRLDSCCIAIVRARGEGETTSNATFLRALRVVQLISYVECTMGVMSEVVAVSDLFE